MRTAAYYERSSVVINAESEGSNVVSREGKGGNIEVLDGSDGRSYESNDTVEVDNTVNGKDTH